MRALFLDVQRPIESRLLDPSSSDKLGSGALSRSARLAKPMREFTIKSWDTLLGPQVEIIRNELHAARITGVFWLYINSFTGEINEPIFIAEGNGVQLEFPMPFNDCFGPSWVISVNQTINTAWTMRDSTLVFTSAPTGRVTGYGKRKYRVVIQDNNDSIMQENQLFYSDDGSVETIEPVVFVEVEGVNVA